MGKGSGEQFNGTASERPRERSSCFETIPVIWFSSSRETRVGVGGQDPVGGANTSGRDHVGPPSSYWRPGEGAGFPVAAAFGRRVTLGEQIVT